MTIPEIVAIANLAQKDKPLGDDYLDGLFNLADTAIYYRFIYHLMKRLKPSVAVELGVCTGRCTAHMAAACPECQVIGIDPDPNPHCLGEIVVRYPNIELWRYLSLDQVMVLNCVNDQTVDLCLIDTTHTIDQVMAEYNAWLPKMKPGGIILIDDISENPSIMQAWEKLWAIHGSDHCASLPHLHHSGFGVILL